MKSGLCVVYLYFEKIKNKKKYVFFQVFWIELIVEIVFSRPEGVKIEVDIKVLGRSAVEGTEGKFIVNQTS